jgi:hypothetical protein
MSRGGNIGRQQIPRRCSPARIAQVYFSQPPFCIRNSCGCDQIRDLPAAFESRRPIRFIAPIVDRPETGYQRAGADYRLLNDRNCADFAVLVNRSRP